MLYTGAKLNSVEILMSNKDTLFSEPVESIKPFAFDDQVVSVFEDELGRDLPQRMGARRGGDVATLLADPSAAEKAMGWTASRGLTDMVTDAWRWAGAARQWGLWDEDEQQSS